MSRCIQPPCRVELARDCLVFPGRDEVIRLNTAGQLGLGERCLVPVREEGGMIEISVEVCPLGEVAGPWRYSQQDLTLSYSLSHQEELCVEMRGMGGLLTLANCDQVEATDLGSAYPPTVTGGEETEMAVERIRTIVQMNNIFIIVNTCLTLMLHRYKYHSSLRSGHAPVV